MYSSNYWYLHVFCILVCLIFSVYCGRNQIYRWGQWSSLPLSCSVTCGVGVRCRVRSCIDGYGKIQNTTALCFNSESTEPQSELCSPCIVHVRCPRIPGWGNWGSWSSCVPVENNENTGSEKCKVGNKARYRFCNNPPPEPPPTGIPCPGSRRQVQRCRYNCEDRPHYAPDEINAQINLQVERDFHQTFRSEQLVIRKPMKQEVRMNCETPAYKLAKRLTIVGVLGASKKGFKSKSFSIKWLKNGKPIQLSEPDTRMMKKRFSKLNYFKKPRNALIAEELRWSSLRAASIAYVEGTNLVLQSITEGDQGFYTCQLTVENSVWNLIFYSLIVTELRYIAQIHDPFYLHSNLGYYNALKNTVPWIDSAQLVWQLNGQEKFRGLAFRLKRRIQSIPHLNFTHQGTWRCFLLVPTPGLPSKVGYPEIPIFGKYMLNEFHLEVRPSSAGLWQLAEHPYKLSILRNVVVALGFVALFLILFLLLTIWAAYRWVKKTLSIDQTKALIQEVADNECRLLLVARKRASVNKEKLLPLILQEQQRMERAHQILTDRMKKRASARISLWRLSRLSALSKRRHSTSLMHRLSRKRDSVASSFKSQISLIEKLDYLKSPVQSEVPPDHEDNEKPLISMTPQKSVSLKTPQNMRGISNPKELIGNQKEEGNQVSVPEKFAKKPPISMSPADSIKSFQREETHASKSPSVKIGSKPVNKPLTLSPPTGQTAMIKEDSSSGYLNPISKPPTSPGPSQTKNVQLHMTQSKSLKLEQASSEDQTASLRLKRRPTGYSFKNMPIPVDDDDDDDDDNNNKL